jgi:hypothetical protein
MNSLTEVIIYKAINDKYIAFQVKMKQDRDQYAMKEMELETQIEQKKAELEELERKLAALADVDDYDFERYYKLDGSTTNEDAWPDERIEKYDEEEEIPEFIQENMKNGYMKLKSHTQAIPSANWGAFGWITSNCLGWNGIAPTCECGKNKVEWGFNDEGIHFVVN